MIKRLIFIFLVLPVNIFAQLTENFESGEISLWTENTTGRWAASDQNPVNGIYSLKHIFDNTVAAADQISIALPAIDMTTNNISWRFRLRYAYAPSSSNNWTVFLAADTSAGQMIPGGAINGYALAVNFSGSDDILKLLKITSGLSSVISTTSVNWELNVGTSLAPAIEVIRKTNGDWEILLNKEGDFENLSLIGTGNDLTFTTAKYFGIYYKYSSTQDQKLWLDDLYFGKEILDTIKPKVSEVRINSSTILELLFSEKMDSSTVVDKLNYTVDDNIGNPDVVYFYNEYRRTAVLEFGQKFSNLQEYSILVQNVTDLKNNAIADTNILFTYEYIKPISVEPDSTNRLVVSFSRYVAVTSGTNPLNYTLDNGFGNPESVSILQGDSSSVFLVFASSFSNKTFYNLTISNVADRALDTMLNAELEFLYFIPEPNDIVINEIMADPSPEVNLPNFEYIEILNNTPFPVDISGWKIKVGNTEKLIPSYLLDSAQYLILCSTTAEADLSSIGEVLGIASLPTITNSGTKISLLKDDNTIISSVAFTTDWYNDNSKVEGGWSLERIDPLNFCSGLTNWRASTDENGGSPGKINSVYDNNIDINPPQIENLEVVSSTQLRLRFNEPVDSATAYIKTNYTVNENIGNPFTILLSTNRKQIDLLFINAFPQFRNLVFTATNIKDDCENLLSNQEIDFSFYIGQAYDIVINEIMADPEPPVYLPAYEYIELYNTTDYNIELADWKIVSGTTVRTLPSYSFQPHSYLILCSENAYPFLKSYGNTLAVSSFPSLSNSGQSIVLKSREGSIISAVSYTDKWYKNSLKADGGWSLEQIDLDNPCGGETNWTASVNSNGGTPGQENSVKASNPDLNAPELLHATVIDNQTIQLFFNESIDSLSAISLNNYIVDQGIGSPISIGLKSPDYFSLTLTFNTLFDLNTTYTIEVSGITDCSGNEINNYNSTQFAIPVSPDFNDLVINEILFNPLSGGVDFVELYNRSQKTIDLKNIKLAAYDDIAGDYTSVKTIAESGYLIFSGDYIVITENPAIVKQHYFTSNERGFIQISSLPTFNDDAGRCILVDKNQVVIDNIAYEESMQFALLSTFDGVSLERVNFDRPSDDKTNWHSAAETVGFATPAYKNSQFKETTESDDRIKVVPEVFSPDNDGFEDILDIQLSFDQPGYVANIKIYDSRGRLVKYLANNLLLGVDNTITWDGLTDENQKTPKGVYVIYFEIFDLKGNVKNYRKPVVVAEKF